MFRTLEMTSGVPAIFWHDPYAVGFVCGYIMAVGICVNHGAAPKSWDITLATNDILAELVPNDLMATAERMAQWRQTNDPEYNLGNTNGAKLAFFVLRKIAANTPEVIEAKRRAGEQSAIFDSLQIMDTEKRVSSVLHGMLFFDRIRKLK